MGLPGGMTGIRGRLSRVDLATGALTPIRNVPGVAFVGQGGLLGVELDPRANDRGGPRISTAGSRVSAWAVPTNEELMIARHTRQLLQPEHSGERSQ